MSWRKQLAVTILCSKILLELNLFQGERQMEAELSNLGGEVMAGQQLQVLLT